MEKHSPNKTIVIVLWTISLMAIGVLILYTHIREVQKPPQAVRYEDSTQNAPHSDTLTVTPNEFKTSFNTAASKLESKLTIQSLTVQSGVVQDTFNIRLTENVSILGTIGDNGLVRSASVIGLGDGTFDSDVDTTLAIATLIISINPDFTITDCYNVIKDTGLTDSHTFSTGEFLLNGNKYFYTRTSDQKLIFSVSKAVFKQ